MQHTQPFTRLVVFCVLFCTVAVLVLPSVVQSADTVSITNSARSSSNTGGNDGADGSDGVPGEDGADGAPGSSVTTGDSRASAGVYTTIGTDGGIETVTETATSGHTAVSVESSAVTDTASATTAEPVAAAVEEEQVTPSIDQTPTSQLTALLLVFTTLLQNYAALLF